LLLLRSSLNLNCHPERRRAFFAHLESKDLRFPAAEGCRLRDEQPGAPFKAFFWMSSPKTCFTFCPDTSFTVLGWGSQSESSLVPQVRPSFGLTWGSCLGPSRPRLASEIRTRTWATRRLPRLGRLMRRESCVMARPFDFAQGRLSVVPIRPSLFLSRAGFRPRGNRGLVRVPGDWVWSSFRRSLTGEEGVVEIEADWTARKRTHGPRVTRNARHACRKLRGQHLKRHTWDHRLGLRALSVT